MIAKQTQDLEIAEKISCPTVLDKSNIVVIVTVSMRMLRAVSATHMMVPLLTHAPGSWLSPLTTFNCIKLHALVRVC